MCVEDTRESANRLKSCFEKLHPIFILSHLFFLASDIAYPFSTKFSDELLFLSIRMLDKKTIIFPTQSSSRRWR